MKRYIIRHGFTGVKRDQRAAFGPEGPPLDELGRKQAAELKQALLKAGIDPANESVAVSNYLRTHQTAELAGFIDIQVSPVLNEIFTGLPGEELKAMLVARQLPSIVLERAQAILDNPPKERVWVTHGLVIIGLRELLGIASDPFDPAFAEINELEI